eukprot:TRINITY_DN32736_c0_g1_i1.p1 TRINITY_DN32736_c0_g1~~TRINITY_DN32736_c0_g1_i1.p1  ORF type:complete len:384 (+),score=57.36 TRINITY_DN32736_c0_g1_i1:51-1154(+)
MKDLVSTLNVAIAYEQDSIPACRQLLERCPKDSAETIINVGCVLYKEGKYEDARQKFHTATGMIGFKPDLIHNIALCYYRMKQYGAALKNIAEIIEKGVREHPELGIGSSSEGMEMRSVGNSQTLKDTALIEAFNLKAAIEYNMKNHDSSKEALTDMPPRQEDELDAVTLHNTGLMQMESEPTGGFNKFNYLLSNPPFPPETIGNLLLLYCKPQNGFYDLAADVMAENRQLVEKLVPKDNLDFLDAAILKQSAPEVAYQKFDLLISRHVDLLRKLTKRIQDARIARDNEKMKQAIAEYDDALEAYVPALMAMAHIYWEMSTIHRQRKFFVNPRNFAGSMIYGNQMLLTLFLCKTTNSRRLCDITSLW